MTQDQACALIAQIQSETALIETSLLHSRAAYYGYSVRLTLIAPTLMFSERLTLTASFADDWPGIRDAWQYWLPDLPIIEHKKRKIGPQYDVDGIPMRFYQMHGGYWCGRYWHNGHETKKYFGKSDPRPLYPLIEKEEVNA